MAKTTIFDNPLLSVKLKTVKTFLDNLLLCVKILTVWKNI